MNALGDRFAAAALAYLDTPFRLHGRDPAQGLDCIGLIERALRDCGVPAAIPADYALRQRDTARWLALVPALGFADAAGPIAPGDIVMVEPGPAQVHVLIAAPAGGWVHAHAGLRRVVLTPGLSDGPILNHWRLRPDAKAS